MGGPLHEAELDFVDALAGLHIARKGDFQQPVQLLPIHGGDEIQPFLVSPQHNVLAEIRMHDFTFHMQNSFQAACLPDGQGHGLVQGYGLLDIIGIDIPGVEGTGHVLVGQKPVHAAFGKFPPRFPAHEGIDFAPVVDMN